MSLSAILIDDEYTSLEILEYELRKSSHEINILGSFEDPVEGIKAIQRKRPDLIFLDVEMPKLNGFELLDVLGNDYNFKVIFVTAYNKYAINAFEYYAIDYLLKPVDPTRLAKAMDKVKNNVRNITKSDLKEISVIVEKEVGTPDKIVVPISKGYRMLEVSTIIRCEADNNYTKIWVDHDKAIYVSKSLVHFENILSTADFLRVHQSHLVNMSKVTYYIKSDGGHLVMNNDVQVPVSRGSKAKVNQYFKDKSV